MEWWEAIVAAFRYIGRAARVAEIRSTIRKRRLYTTSGETPGNSIGNEIRKRLVGHRHRHADRQPKVFRKFARGLYGLAEWGDSRTAPVFADRRLQGLFPSRSSLVENSGQWPAEEIQEPDCYVEGAKRTVTVTAHERDPKARAACIRRWKAVCCVCEFDFKKTYGELGSGFMFVHHLAPLSQVDEAYELVPEEDLRPVCGNCHAMLHKRRPPLTPEELRELLAQARET